MAFATITFENPKSGKIRQAPIGFSWTTLFFGFIPAVFRQHWAGAVIQLVCAFFTIGLSGIVFAFIYNKMYVKHLIGDGFKSVDDVPDFIESKVGMRIPKAA